MSTHDAEANSSIDTVDVERRGDGGGLSSIFIGGEPIGALLQSQRERIEDLEDNVDDLRDELNEERRKRQAAEDVAETALGIANQLDDGTRSDGGPTKVDRARLSTRNELIRQAATSNGKAAVTTSTVRAMNRPEVDLAWQTVMDAWTSLEEQWSAFFVERNEDEDHRLLLDGDAVDASIVRAVERDLGRDDLTKSLVGGRD
jgi:hypothetical protein